MAIPARQRWVIYAIVLALALTTVRWAGGQDRAEPPTTVAYQAERLDRPARDAKAEAVPEVRLDWLERRAIVAPTGDPFQARSWEPPQPAPATARYIPPPPPQAPPLPFTYFGRLIDGEETTVFLSRQDHNYVVRLGDTLDGTYRVEAIAEDGLALTYLPLGIQQTLSFGATPTLASATPLQFGATPAPASATPRKPRSEDQDDDE